MYVLLLGKININSLGSGARKRKYGFATDGDKGSTTYYFLFNNNKQYFKMWPNFNLAASGGNVRNADQTHQHSIFHQTQPEMCPSWCINQDQDYNKMIAKEHLLGVY